MYCIKASTYKSLPKSSQGKENYWKQINETRKEGLVWVNGKTQDDLTMG